MEKDKNGYPRGKINHSDLIHRQIAYSEIYLKNRDKYPLPFSKYQIHHKDGNKENFLPSNLQIVTEEEHRALHGLPPKNKVISKGNSEKAPDYIKYYPIKSEDKKEKITRTIKLNPTKKYISRKRKTWFWIILILLVLGLAVYPITKDRLEIMNNADLPTNPIPIACTLDAKLCPDGSYVGRVAPSCEFADCPVSIPVLEDYVVKGSQKEVIIENNLQEEITLNVTYRIYSKWFGTDRTENRLFEVAKNTTKAFLVYDNTGCGVGDCSVSIITFSEIEPLEKEPSFFEFQDSDRSDEEIRQEIAEKITLYEQSTKSAMDRISVLKLANSWQVPSPKKSHSGQPCSYTMEIEGYEYLVKIVFQTTCLGGRNKNGYVVEVIR